MRGTRSTGSGGREAQNSESKQGGSKSGKKGLGSLSPPAHSAASNAAQLTSCIKNSWTLDALFETFSKYQSDLNHIHLSAVWSSLGHGATKSADASWHQRHATTLEALIAKTVDTVERCPDVRGRQIANIAHGAAKAGRGGASMALLLRSLAAAVLAEDRLSECNTQELANIAWAFAKASHSDVKLFAEIARVSKPYLAEFNPQEVANTIWAFATSGHRNAKFFGAVARACEKRLKEFSSQGLANTAWAFARTGHLDAAFFRALSEAARQRLDEFNAQDLANTAWAFSKLGHADNELFCAMAKATEWHLKNFSAQGLANTVWAFAKAGLLDPHVFGVLAKAVRKRVRELNAQDLANAAWAFARACHVDVGLFGALARATEECITEFNLQDLVNMAWAFAKTGQHDAGFFTRVASALCKSSLLDDLQPAHIANLAWAFAKADQRDEQLFKALANSAQVRIAEFGAADLATVAWAFANAGQTNLKVFESLADAAGPFVEQFDEEELDNTEWAFARAGQTKIVKALRQRRKLKGGSSGIHSLLLEEASSRQTIKRKRESSPVDMSGVGRIVVAGGGIGGAALAVALQSRGFQDVVVLEADESFSARKQGYGLTIQAHDATLALGLHLAPDDAPSTSHYTFSAEGEILGFYGEAFGARSKDRPESDNSGRFVHIPRQKLRQRLIEQIARPDETIRWNSKLKSFSVCAKSGQVTCELNDGTMLEAALLVGSDGIFSTVRKQMQLPGDRLNYVGLVVVLGILPTAPALSRRSAGASCPAELGPDAGGANGRSHLRVPLTERRIFETVDGETRIYAMPFTTDSTMWQLSFPYEEQAACRLCKDQAALKAEIIRRCAAWHDPIGCLLQETPLDGFSGYAVYDRDLLDPKVLRPTEDGAGGAARSKRRVTLIGDAAHPMTPFRAQGANQALSDAVLLADALAAGIVQHGHESGVEAALPIFERKMLNRSARAVTASRQKAKEMHSHLALQAGRKVQREAGVDAQKAIRMLREAGVGAHSAADPRGLDAVVAEALGMAVAGPASGAGPEHKGVKRTGKEVVSKKSNAKTEAVTSVETKNTAVEPATGSMSLELEGKRQPTTAGKEEGGLAKKRRTEIAMEAAGEVEAQARARERLWGFFGEEWHKCLLVRTRKSGKHLVEWRDGTTSVLDGDCVQRRRRHRTGGASEGGTMDTCS